MYEQLKEVVTVGTHFLFTWELSVAVVRHISIDRPARVTCISPRYSFCRRTVLPSLQILRRWVGALGMLELPFQQWVLLATPTLNVSSHIAMSRSPRNQVSHRPVAHSQATPARRFPPPQYKPTHILNAAGVTGRPNV